MNEESVETNTSLKEDEIQALFAIYGEDCTFDGLNHFSIEIANEKRNKVCLQITLPEDYPLSSPPRYEISAPWMSRIEKIRLCSELEEIYCAHIGESVLYLWIEKIRNFIISNENHNMKDNDLGTFSHLESLGLGDKVRENFDNPYDELPPIHHGEPIIDRKSIFQARVAKVITVEQVKQILSKLKENRKIATATHNIVAYRIYCEDKASFLQDCDDDGETKAGSSLLHLLQILDVRDIVVIVTRWYGGIHLGSDRFKHINNTARILLSELGYVKNRSKSGSSKLKK